MSITSEEAVREIRDLPVLSNLMDPQWGADVVGLAEELFAQPYRGPMQAPWGEDLIVYTSDDLEALRQHPLVAHQTAEAATGHLAQYPNPPEVYMALLPTTVTLLGPEDHGPEKLMVAKTLAPKAIAGLRPVFGSAVRRSITEALGRDVVDFKRDVVLPAVAAFWSSGLGLTEEEVFTLFETAAVMTPGVGAIEPSQEQLDRCEEGCRRYLDILVGGLRRSGEVGGFPLVDALLAAHAQGGGEGVLSDPYQRLAGSMFDGFSSVPSLLTSFAYVAASQAVDLAQGGADPQQYGASYFLEASRLHPAVNFTFRQVKGEFVHAGVRIPEGTNVVLFWLFGNRDPDYFPDPDRFELQRPNRVRQYSFGGGLYVCPGRNVAQALGEVMMSELAQESIDIELVEEPTWMSGSFFHELEELKVRLSRGVG